MPPLPADPLARLALLERRYDGPIPEPERACAELGAEAALALLAAAGNAAFFRHMARRQLALIRRRRADRSFYPALLADLRLYRDRWRFWHRRHRALAAVTCRWHEEISSS